MRRRYALLPEDFDDADDLPDILAQARDCGYLETEELIAPHSGDVYMPSEIEIRRPPRRIHPVRWFTEPVRIKPKPTWQRPGLVERKPAWRLPVLREMPRSWFVQEAAFIIACEVNERVAAWTPEQRATWQKDYAEAQARVANDHGFREDIARSWRAYDASFVAWEQHAQRQRGKETRR